MEIHSILIVQPFIQPTCPVTSLSNCLDFGVLTPSSTTSYSALVAIILIMSFFVISVLGFNEEDILLCSGKTGLGVDKLLEAIVERIPAPNTKISNTA